MSGWVGSGTVEDPIRVTFHPNDPLNPKNFKSSTKWSATLVMAFATFTVALTSSAYSGGQWQVMREFGLSELGSTLGMSLFVLGFSIGPVFWAPLSELYGRRPVFIVSFGVFTVFNAAAAGARNATSLLVFRFLAGAFGSSPLSNGGGVVSDMFSADRRGSVSTLYAAAPSMGPVIGPLFGNFAAETISWRWILGICCAISGTIWILGSLMPETYEPVILQRIAKKLTKETGKIHASVLDDIEQTPRERALNLLSTSILRPWQLLFYEPICLLFAVLMAIAYGTLYLTFPAFPYVYGDVRGWSQGIAGLSFLGVGVGQIIGLLYYVWDNRRYRRVAKASPTGQAPPEARLPPCMVATIMLPAGLIVFAWTNSPNIHWIVSVLATVPFGFGLVILFLVTINYLLDVYTIYSASAVAANTIMRSLLGFAFPLFTRKMFVNLGIHWAAMVPALLTLACLPFPFIFYKYGEAIRKRCKYAAHGAMMAARMRQSNEEMRET
ncbi:hypothetical protein FE257_010747 [Aspergillus nanangensis]|uniref:Major facilitator superfamily (MFS) profile domain-containing protein n=1 Tax=Aspergillus nanangensis TaxID=2582783 RepID=A0AAD4CVF7_ASPNN|nr:hypothetical protein FE257_010747 [Aspergillus nanangensis]